jgi:pyruvate dehydrogenase E1 component beta subunit
MTYGHTGEVPDEEYVTPIGKARHRSVGTDITLISWGKHVLLCEEVVADLTKQGISVDFLDLRSLRPLDESAIYESVAKTGKCVVTHEGHLYAGVGAEIVARIQQMCFKYLEAPVLRVTNRDVPQPYATILEQTVMPTSDRVLEACHNVLNFQS